MNPNLPPYVVLCEHLPYGGSQLWDSAFLPPVHQGARVIPGAEPVPNLKPAVENLTLRQLESQLLDDLNAAYQNARPGDLEARARSSSFQTARGMMSLIPEIFRIQEETPETLELYGVPANDQSSFAWQCLVARRLAEQVFEPSRSSTAARATTGILMAICNTIAPKLSAWISPASPHH